MMPDINGLDVLRAIPAIDPTCQIVSITGQPSVDTAIKAVKLGALDYISKPFDIKRLRRLLTGVCKNIERRERLLQVNADVARDFAFYGIIGRSPAMQELFDAVRRFAPHVRTVSSPVKPGPARNWSPMRCTRSARALISDL